VIAVIAYFFVFNNFEKHLPFKRRVIKLFVVIGTLAVIGIFFGRYLFWGIIFVMTVGQAILHGWYFPKEGINGLTAEPYDQYLATIQRMKGKDKEQTGEE
jgi:hypothetical protein